MLGTPLTVVFTKSGFTARTISSHRPDVPILALTDVERTYRQLALVWGVLPELVPPAANYDEMLEHGRAAVIRRGLAAPGDRVLVTAGVPFDIPGTTNLLKVEVV
jgi:pyruvate kinase